MASTDLLAAGGAGGSKESGLVMGNGVSALSMLMPLYARYAWVSGCPLSAGVSVFAGVLRCVERCVKTTTDLSVCGGWCTGV